MFAGGGVQLFINLSKGEKFMRMKCRNSILLFLCFGFVLIESSCGSSTTTEFTLTYAIGTTISPSAVNYSYTFSSTGVATRTVTTNFDDTSCGEDSATLNSFDLSSLEDSISYANLLEQSDAIDEQCIGVGFTTYSYTQGTQNNEFDILDCTDAGVEPSEVAALREALNDLIAFYFTTEITCP